MRARSATGVLSIVALLVCVRAGSARVGDAPVDVAPIVAQLQATVGAWNKGDLDAFIAPYAADSTYMTREGPVGREAMRSHYEETFFAPGGGTPRPLRFERIEVRPLGADHALMTGRFILGGDGKPDQSGWFTLVWVRTPQGWRIVHDHSS